MNKMRFGACFGVLLITVAGCGVRPATYQANARISTRPRNPADRGQIIIVPLEVKLLQTMAASIVTGTTHQVSVRSFPDTDLIEVSVAATDPSDAADLANRIAERFVAAAGEGDIERHLVEKATPPKRPLR